MKFQEFIRTVFSSWSGTKSHDVSSSYDDAIFEEEELTIPDEYYSIFIKKGLGPAFKAMNNDNLDSTRIEEYISKLLWIKYSHHCYGEMLSFMYKTGKDFNWHPVPLLKKLYERKEYDTFIKQAYRFNMFIRLQPLIESVLQEWEAAGKNDVYAWRGKLNDVIVDNEISKI